MILAMEAPVKTELVTRVKNAQPREASVQEVVLPDMAFAAFVRHFTNYMYVENCYLLTCSYVSFQNLWRLI